MVMFKPRAFTCKDCCLNVREVPKSTTECHDPLQCPICLEAMSPISVATNQIFHQSLDRDSSIFSCLICDSCYSDCDGLNRHFEENHIRMTEEKKPIVVMFMSKNSTQLQSTVVQSRLPPGQLGLTREASSLNMDLPYQPMSKPFDFAPIETERVADFQPLSTDLMLPLPEPLSSTVESDSLVNPRDGATVLLCQICNSKFMTQKELEYHADFFHLNPNPTTDAFMCGSCQTKFYQISSLYLHSKSHPNVGGTEKIFGCNVCQSVFDDCEGLIDHFKIGHANASGVKESVFEPKAPHGTSEIECPQCRLKVSGPSDLDAHKDLFHLNKNLKVNPFRCNLCCHSFNQIRMLQAHCKRPGHQKAQETVDLYACLHCDTHYPNPEGLIRHFKDEHVESAPVSLGVKFPPVRSASPPVRAATDESDPKFRNFGCGCDVETLFELYQMKGSSEEKKKLHENLYHLNPDEEVRPFRCSLCGDVFSQIILLLKHAKGEDHQQFQDSRNLFGCLHCPMEFKDEHQLIEHFRSEHQTEAKQVTGEKSPNQEFPCTRCSEKFPSWLLLNRHIKFTHKAPPKSNAASTDKSEEKPDRGNSTAAVETAAKSIEDDLSEETVFCEICNAEFRSKDFLQKHIEAKHSNSSANAKKETKEVKAVNEKEWVCDECTQKFKYSYLLFRHKKLHSVANQPTAEPSQSFPVAFNEPPNLNPPALQREIFQCPHCSLSFFKKFLLDNHLKQRHAPAQISPDRNIFPCRDCPAVFDRRELLVKHIMDVNATFPAFRTPFCCGCCPESFFNIKDLETHLERAPHKNFDSIEAKFCCGMCSARFVSKDTLIQHFQFVHMTGHMRSKTVPDLKGASAERSNFDCPLCDMKFDDQQGLMSHKDLYHLNSDNNSKPFKCGMCSMAFKQVVVLDYHCQDEAHKKVSLVCELYSCAVCQNSAFTSKESLIQHFKQIHSADNAESEVSVNDIFIPISNLNQIRDFATNFIERVGSIRDPKMMIQSTAELASAVSLRKALAAAIEQIKANPLPQLAAGPAAGNSSERFVPPMKRPIHTSPTAVPPKRPPMAPNAAPNPGQWYEQENSPKPWQQGPNRLPYQKAPRTFPAKTNFEDPFKNQASGPSQPIPEKKYLIGADWGINYPVIEPKRVNRGPDSTMSMTDRLKSQTAPPNVVRHQVAGSREPPSRTGQVPMAPPPPVFRKRN